MVRGGSSQRESKLHKLFLHQKFGFHSFHLKDVLQVVVGAAILATPVGFTQEVWELGQTLALQNIIGFLILSLLFIGGFVNYNYYRHVPVGKHKTGFMKRVLSTYVVSFIVAAVFLTLIEKAPWGIDFVLAFNRTVLVAFPASMSAAVADIIK